MKLEGWNLVVAIIIGVASLGVAAYQYFPKPPIVPESSRFYCALQPDKGKEVWTVIYRHDKGAKPWLKIVSALSDGWNTQKRCLEIARKLDIYRLDGLMELTYRDDPKTPSQSVICAKTRISGNNCPLLVTLKAGVDPYLTMREMASTLLSEGGSIYLSPNGGTPISSFSPSSPVINLENLLAEEDRKVGSSAAK